MTGSRAIAYRNVLLVMLGLSTLFFLGLSKNGIDPLGRPIGTDFISFWAAATVAATGHPAAVYDIATHWAAQQAQFPDVKLPYTAFFYPPVYLLFCMPLALLPYFWSLGIWLLATGFACLRTLQLRGSEVGIATILAFPAAYVNVLHGQNGFLTTALFAGGFMALPRRPVVAGICFGCLVYKPHLAILLPLALLSCRRWVTLTVAAVTAMALCAASALVFGLDTWRGFLAGIPVARQALEDGLVGDAKMQSLFAAARMFGVELHAAYAMQTVVTLLMAALVVYLCVKRPAAEATGALVAAASLLSTPFLLAYDLMLLALPLIWIYACAHRTGFLPWERFILVVSFALPLISSSLSTYLHVPVAPIVIAAVVWAVMRRIGQPPLGWSCLSADEYR
jgi:alpha-1,2-mannosyltransferase